MLSVQSSLNMGIQYSITVKHSLMLFTYTPPKTNICTPLCRHVDNESITFSGRKQSSTMIIGLCNSCRHTGKLQNDHHQKWSTYLHQFHLNIKYKKGKTNHVADCLNQSPIVVLTIALNPMGMRRLSGHNYTILTLTLLLPIIN
jgi:hypothetical protein